jgi:hypothetical protein
MTSAKKPKGKGGFHPDPKRDKTLIKGERECRGLGETDCDLNVTEEGEFYFYQSAQLWTSLPGGARELEDYILIEHATRLQAVRWALDFLLPPEFHRDVKIVGEEVVA